MLFVSEAQHTEDGEDDGEANQDARLQGNTRYALTPQYDVCQPLHRPSRGQDVHNGGDRAGEALDREPAAAQQRHRHTQSDAEVAGLSLRFREGPQHGA